MGRAGLKCALKAAVMGRFARRSAVVASAAGVLLTALAGQAAESRLGTMRRLRQEAAALTVQADYPAATARLRRARALFPASPGTLAELASAQVRAGDRAGAVATLDRYARLGLTLDLGARPELAGLRGRRDFAAVADRLAVNARPRGRLLWQAPIAGRAPLEGVAYDPRTGRVFLGLVGGQAILAGGRERGFAPLTRPGAIGAGVYGLAFDGPRGSLWATVAAGDDIPGSAGPPRSALLRLDAATGEILARYAAPGPGHQLGDVALGPDGAVYVSEGRRGVILRLRPETVSLEPFVSSTELGATQGMVLADRGRALVVADYATGLHRIDLATARIAPLPAPPETALAGIDGLSADGPRIYATQNGITPQRVLRLTLSRDARRIVRVETVLASARDAGDLALGAVAGEAFVFSARSGWEAGPGPPSSPVLAAISLDPGGAEGQLR